MCELSAHIEGKESCASCISSPVNAIINIFHSLWPGMCSALEYGEFFIGIVVHHVVQTTILLRYT